MCLPSRVREPERMRRASKPNVAGVGVLSGCRECRWLGGDAPEDHGSGLLNGFQALPQEIGVSVPKLDVVLGCGSILESDRLANDKGYCLASVSRSCLVVSVRRSPR